MSGTPEGAEPGATWERGRPARIINSRPFGPLRAGRPRLKDAPLPGTAGSPMPVEKPCVRSLFDMVRVDPTRSRRGGAPVAFVVFRKTVE